MNYQIIGSTVPAVEFSLQPSESLFTQSGGMAWQSDGIVMSTNARGGFMKGLGRMLSGESFFMATYTAQKAATIAFSCSVPGGILPLDMALSQGLTIQKGAFLCAEQSVNMETVLAKKFSSGLFGGEGFILQRLSGSGMAFLEVDGDAIERVLAPGEVLKVDTGNVVAFEDSVQYEIETVKGMGNIFFGGEGLFLTKLTGPGKVVLQTLSFGDLAGRVLALAPPSGGR